MKQSSKIDITIFVPTFNAEAYLSDILTSVYEQKIDKKFEVLIIDSGSKDNTLDIIASFPEVVLHEIPNREFGHGKTRQLAAEMAKGEIVVYLSHDAIPSHRRWLYELTKPLELYKSVAGVTGKQIPRQHCAPMLKYEIQSVFKQFGPDFGFTIFYKDDFIKDRSVYDAVRFYSDVNSATRKSILLNEVPYKDVDYAEDQIFGEDIIEAGYQKVYAPRGSVVHSNDVPLKEYDKRIFDETFGLKKAGVDPGRPSKKHLLILLPKSIVKDSARIILDKDYTLPRKLYWLLLNPVYRTRKWRGNERALKTKVESKNIGKNSLEAKTRAES